MSQGMQVWDGNGNLILDASTLVGKLIGQVAVSENQLSGTISDTQLSYGTPFLVALFGTGKAPATGSQVGNPGSRPSFGQLEYSSQGSTMSWSRKQNAYDINPSGILYYGVY